MPKKDKNREMEERLARIEDGLARSDVNYAVRQLGDGLDVFNFDPTKPMNALSLYRSASVMDERSGRPDGFVKRLEGLYDQVLRALEDYQREKAKATITSGQVTPRASIDAVVDVTIEAIPFGDKFSVIFRTAETRRLDNKFDIAGRKGLQIAPMGYGVTEIEMSNIMPILEWIANKAGYFAGVRVDELERYAKGFELETHVAEGFVAVKTHQADGVKADIVVPVRFY